MERLFLNGRRFGLVFEGRKEEGSYVAGEYINYKVKCRWWEGNGCITGKESGQMLIFHFHTRSRGYNRWNWHYQTLKDELPAADYVIKGDGEITDSGYPRCGIYLSVENFIDPPALVDYYAEKILEVIVQSKNDTIIPTIRIPILSVEELRSLRFIAERDGQLKLAC